MPEVNGIDLDEALRLIRRHMQPGDTLGRMFMRVARALEQCETVTSEQAAIDVKREREAMEERKRYEQMSTAERCKLQGDGFINDYD